MSIVKLKKLADDFETKYQYDVAKRLLTPMELKARLAKILNDIAKDKKNIANSLDTYRATGESSNEHAASALLHDAIPMVASVMEGLTKTIVKERNSQDIVSLLQIALEELRNRFISIKRKYRFSLPIGELTSYAAFIKLVNGQSDVVSNQSVVNPMGGEKTTFQYANPSREPTATVTNDDVTGKHSPNAKR